MKKAKLLIMLPALCLTSCASKTIYGTYSFSMGKKDGTNLGVSIEFKEEDYAGIDSAKKCTFNICSGDSASWIMQLMDNGIEGYYTISDIKDKNFGTKVTIGAIIDHEHYPDIIPEDFAFTIPNDIIEKVVSVYWKKNVTTLLLPVSLDDLSYEFAWCHGYYVDAYDLVFEKLPAYKMPGFDITKKDDEEYITKFYEGKRDTHPDIQKDEDGNVIYNPVKEMNENYAYDFARQYLYNPINDDVLGRIGQIGHDFYYFSIEELVTDTVQGSLGWINVELTLDKNTTSKFDNGYLITSMKDMKNDEVFEKANYLDVISAPFAFRNFHTLNIGLAKESK